LIEVVVAGALLIFGLLAISTTTLRTQGLKRHVGERNRVNQALRAVTEELHATSAAARKDPATWRTTMLAALAPGGAIGNDFDVPGLESPMALALPGSLQVVLDETTTDAALGAQLGMPRDLNGDGDRLDNDVSQDATMLPVVIRVQWSGTTGVQDVTLPVHLLGL
jgi:Tfp pilus assembly protein PilV